LIHGGKKKGEVLSAEPRVEKKGGMAKGEDLGGKNTNFLCSCQEKGGGARFRNPLAQKRKRTTPSRKRKKKKEGDKIDRFDGGGENKKT